MNMVNENQESAGEQVSRANRHVCWPKLIALVVGIISAFLSISLEHPVSFLYGKAGVFITALLIPGLISSAAIARNPHAFSLWIAAGINGVFYCFIVLMIFSLLRWIFHRVEVISAEFCCVSPGYADTTPLPGPVPGATHPTAATGWS